MGMVAGRIVAVPGFGLLDLSIEGAGSEPEKIFE